MVRHSGFLTSIAVILLAALSVSFLERRSDGNPRISRSAAIDTGLRPVQLDRFRQDSGRDASRSTPVAGRPGATIRFRVPENSLTIVGSLDVSGAAHSLLISSRRDGRQIADESACSKDLIDLEYMEIGSLSDLRCRLQEPGAGRLNRAAPEVVKRPQPLLSAPPSSVRETRRFLIPHFEFDQVVQQPCEASLLADGTRVKVYLDRDIAQSYSEVSQLQRMCAEAERVCTTIECELLPNIERWIGRISDLDGDQHLSVVLTDLDRRPSTDETPILGCVRRGDFEADQQNPLAGDIVYLDRHLPLQEQLLALLAHELTHAAIFCIRHEAPDDSLLRNHSIPSWLNEAAAHWVERQFCSNPAGYAAREAAFRRSPALCPIILNEEDQYLTDRRTGSRVAGFTFLQQHLTDARDLRALLEHSSTFDRSISAIAEAPFSQLFRLWTISQACDHCDAFSPLHATVNCSVLMTADSGPVPHKLHGTAFMVLRSEAEQTVCIEAPSDIQLQITVLQPVSLIQTQYAGGVSTPLGLWSADPENLTHQGMP